MRGQDTVTMSLKEQRRLKVVEQAIEKKITRAEAGEVLDLSERQIRRLVKRVREEGPRGVVHRCRGRPSNRKIPDRVRARVVSLYGEQYWDFGSTFASEKLLE